MKGGGGKKEEEEGSCELRQTQGGHMNGLLRPSWSCLWWLQEAGPSQDPRPCRLQCEDSFWLLSSVVDASAGVANQVQVNSWAEGRVALAEIILRFEEVSVCGHIHDYGEIALKLM